MARVAIAVALLLGCTPLEREDPHPRITDPLGDEFFWTCTDGRTTDNCVHRIVGESPPLPECEFESGRYTWGGGRFLNVRPQCPTPRGVGWIESDRTRFLICETDDDCPRLDFYDLAWECDGGYCQSTDVANYPRVVPDIDEMVILCMGDEPRWEDSRDDEDAELFALLTETACPSIYDGPCESIPPGCPDPR